MFSTKATDIFEKSPPLARLVQKAQLLMEMNSIVVPHLPEECQAYCRVANFENGILTLGICKQQIITPLRFIVPDLIPTLQKYPVFVKLESIKTKIMLTESTRKQEPLTPKALTPRQQTIVEELKVFLSSTIKQKN